MDKERIYELINKYLKAAIVEYSDLEELRHNAVRKEIDGKVYQGFSQIAVHHEMEKIKRLLEEDSEAVRKERQTYFQSVLQRSNIQEEAKTLTPRELSMLEYELLKAESNVLLHDSQRASDLLVTTRGEDTQLSWGASQKKETLPQTKEALMELIGQTAPEIKQAFETDQKRVNPPLDELFDEFMKHKQTKGKMDAKTVKEAEYTYKLFKDITGAKTLSDLNNSTLMTTFIDTLPSLVTNMTKRFPTLSTLEILKVAREKNLTNISPATHNKHLNMMSSLLTYLEQTNRGKFMNMSIHHMPDTKTKKEKKEKMELDEVIKVFGSDFYQCKGFDKALKQQEASKAITRVPILSKFWIPWIALFSGARLEEIAQIRPEDIKQIDDIYYIEVAELAEKEENTIVRKNKAKTVSSRRKIPIHHTLIDMGILEYFDFQIHKGVERIFETEPKIIESQYTTKYEYGNYVSEYFRKYTAKFGVHKSFHSLRHTVIDMYHWTFTDVSQLHKWRVFGHSGELKLSESEQTYGGDIPVHQAKAIIDKITYKGLNIPKVEVFDC